MRTPIPQELIDAIIHGVEDMESLKCCSLVSTRFRGASQRILLRSLTLYHTWNHGTVACTLLTESPHTASYIKNITLNLPSWLPNGHAAAGRLRAAFDKLTYVRQVAIDGNNVSWDVVSPLASTIFDFIRNRDLKELHVQRVQNLPWPALATLISSAPVVSMDEVLPLEEVDVVMPQNGDLPVSNLRRLLASYSDAACDVLARPEFAFCLPKLRELGLDHTPVNSSLLSAASARLDSVYFDLAHHISTAFLPPLPGLRTIHMALHWGSDANSQCMSDAIASILVSGPATALCSLAAGFWFRR
ncbi:hypothetical protein C8R43DRAFT_1230466 [Mycena crocata]|nr:hypothetical protein C8R43DRAFT_1230466 [Mycena crocata]